MMTSRILLIKGLHLLLVNLYIIIYIYYILEEKGRKEKAFFENFITLFFIALHSDTLFIHLGRKYLHCHVRWVSCRHSMIYFRVVDGGAVIGYRE
jgi:hypothetical protein